MFKPCEFRFFTVSKRPQFLTKLSRFNIDVTTCCQISPVHLLNRSQINEQAVFEHDNNPVRRIEISILGPYKPVLVNNNVITIHRFALPADIIGQPPTRQQHGKVCLIVMAEVT